MPDQIPNFREQQKLTNVQETESLGESVLVSIISSIGGLLIAAGALYGMASWVRSCNESKSHPGLEKTATWPPKPPNETVRRMQLDRDARQGVEHAVAEAAKTLKKAR